MALYATGLNAWNQLDFGSIKKEQEPDDIFTFTCVLKDNDTDYVRPFPSYTLVYTTRDLLTPTHSSGLIPKSHQKLSSHNPHHYLHFAEASNDTIVIPNHPTNPYPIQYPSLTNLLNSAPVHTPLSYPSLKISQLSAYATGFIALSTPSPSEPSPQVHSWGDPRYPPCLARPTCPITSPASTPSPIPDLLSLPTGPIVKISSCSSGYLLAALTAGNDLYIWGHASRCASWFPNVPHRPEPVLIGSDDGKDIADVAVGQSHIIVLTTDNEIWGRGDNSSGQLGLGRNVKMTKEWTRLKLDCGEDDNDDEKKRERIKGVWAGERNSFVIVEPA
ncbi:regulator of chromosome condensation 1/beta-lactamase-inhibitor protein II [Apiosordaria backusii]|uniref:Regulator of chromosome condensation 1/beta-lactamase-inhibitor protein II n=1 Tax=Apiosordaria backusii TaxID=314023 RepID=A0AA40EY22_9PEZI|nr:regulator of chromosome condensation 1/beta-lactamase-inhibitor protein II [Apiosordaria backusii]